MERKIYQDFLKWKNSPSKKALLLQGARQTGKTYSVKEFASKEYKSYAYFNLEERKDIQAVFEQNNLSGSSILEGLSYHTDVKLVPGKSAIILDEIQTSMSAYSSLKTLVEDGRYDIIASGSLLGIKISDLQRLSPMGYVDFFEMLPMDFEEFLWALGLTHEQTGYIGKCVAQVKPINESVLHKIEDLYRRYMVIGGMPMAVYEFVQTKDYVNVGSKLDHIVNMMRMDAERYSKSTDRLKISACLESMPSQLAKKSKKFKYYDVEKKKGAGSKTYASTLLWLNRAGIASYCYNLSEPVIPLTERIKYDSFKAYLMDTGVLIRLMEHGIASEIVEGNPYVNNGAIVENSVACALRSRGYRLLYYEREHSTLEIDFVINEYGSTVAIEVKSGRNKRAKSLRTLFVSDKRVDKAVKLSEGNIMVDNDGIIHMPLFAPYFFERADSRNPFAEDDFSELGDMIDDAMFLHAREQ